MNTAYLLTGGNIGDRASVLHQATHHINNGYGTIISASALYETAAWGNTNQALFLNQALQVQTPLNAAALLHGLLDIEKSLGRIRHEKYDPRVIDIDILLFNEEVHNFPFLKIPHPELHNRRFALVPLTEIAAEKIHPVFNKTIETLLFECTDQLQVKLYP